MPIATVGASPWARAQRRPQTPASSAAECGPGAAHTRGRHDRGRTLHAPPTPNQFRQTTEPSASVPPFDLAGRACRGIPSPLYWRSTAQLPTGWTARTTSPGRKSARGAQAQGHPGTPDEAADLVNNAARFRAGLWKLPELWTHRTRPQLLGNHRPFSTATTAPYHSSNGQGRPASRRRALARDRSFWARARSGAVRGQDPLRAHYVSLIRAASRTYFEFQYTFCPT